MSEGLTLLTCEICGEKRTPADHIHSLPECIIVLQDTNAHLEREIECLTAKVDAMRINSSGIIEEAVCAANTSTREVLIELLRLYDWRFELAKRERNSLNDFSPSFEKETQRLLRQYGTEKLAAWEAARRALYG